MKSPHSATGYAELPICFDPLRDPVGSIPGFNFVQHIAGLLPVYGRETGTGHPGICYFNRGAAPLLRSAE